MVVTCSGARRLPLQLHHRVLTGFLLNILEFEHVPRVYTLGPLLIVRPPALLGAPLPGMPGRKGDPNKAGGPPPY